MLRIGNYNPNNCNIRNNKNMQSQPAFGVKITPDMVIRIAQKRQITPSQAQRLGDMAEWINKDGLITFKQSHMYNGQMKVPKMGAALVDLEEIAKLGK